MTKDLLPLWEEGGCSPKMRLHRSCPKRPRHEKHLDRRASALTSPYLSIQGWPRPETHVLSFPSFLE